MMNGELVSSADGRIKVQSAIANVTRIYSRREQKKMAEPGSVKKGNNPRTLNSEEGDSEWTIALEALKKASANLRRSKY
jgi:hypothetical protein